MTQEMSTDIAALLSQFDAKTGQPIAPASEINEAVVRLEASTQAARAEKLQDPAIRARAAMKVADQRLGRHQCPSCGKQVTPTSKCMHGPHAGMYHTFLI